MQKCFKECHSLFAPLQKFPQISRISLHCATVVTYSLLNPLRKSLAGDLENGFSWHAFKHQIISLNYFLRTCLPTATSQTWGSAVSLWHKNEMCSMFLFWFVCFCTCTSGRQRFSPKGELGLVFWNTSGFAMSVKWYYEGRIPRLFKQRGGSQIWGQESGAAYSDCTFLEMTFTGHDGAYL